MAERGQAQSEWLRQGNGMRRIPGLPFADLVILPGGRALALVPAGLTDRAEDAAFASLLWRCWLARCGHAAMREQMRAWTQGDPAD